MSKVSFLVAVSVVLALAIWAGNRNMGSDPIQPSDSASPSPKSQSSDRNLPPSLVQGETRADNATTTLRDGDDTESRDFATLRDPVFAQDSGDSSIFAGGDRLENEPIDTEWAPQMESVMWSTVSTIGEVLEVECRTTICRTAVVPIDSNVPALTQNRVLMESFQSIIRNSDGRLDGVRVGVFGDAHGRSGITIDLFGPPLEAAATDSP